MERLLRHQKTWGHRWMMHKRGLREVRRDMVLKGKEEK
jgi:hypothetical protein